MDHALRRLSPYARERPDDPFGASPTGGESNGWWHGEMAAEIDGRSREPEQNREARWRGHDPAGLRPRLMRPRLSPTHVTRPRLIAEMSRERSAPVTLVVAPSGSGKTMLLGEWSSGWPHAVAWLSLDVDLDDPGIHRLAQAILVAVRAVSPGFGRAISTVVESGEVLDPRELGAALGSELHTAPQPLALVFDDLQECVSEGALLLLAELVAGAPATTHVLLAARTLPALPLDSWADTGRLARIRAADLRFAAADAAALAAALGVDDLDAGAIVNAVAASGGWIALLRLMLVGARTGGAGLPHPRPLSGARELGDDGSPHPRPLSRARERGDDRGDRWWQEAGGAVDEVAGALVDAMLAELPATDADALTWAAVTETTCVGLAQAVVPDGASADEVARWLDRLASEGVWLMPVGDVAQQPPWYRIHLLVRDRLRERLELAVGTAGVAAAKRRAAVWFRAEGMIDEAVVAGLQAGDVEWVVALVAEAGFAAIDHERWGVAERLLDLLPPSLVDERASLLALRAWNAYRLGRPIAFTAETSRMRAVLDGPEREHPDRERLLAHAEVIDRFADRGDGAFANALAAFRRILPAIPASDGMARGIFVAATGLASLFDGQFDDGLGFLHERLATNPGTIEQALGLAATAMLHGFGGRDPGAERGALERLHALASAADLPVSLAFASSRLGWLALKRMDLDEAGARFAESASAPATPLVNAWREERFGLSLVRQLTGQDEAALEIAEEVIRTVDQVDDLPMAENSRAFRAQLWLLQRQYGAVDSWLDDIAIDPGGDLPLWRIWTPEIWVQAQLTRVPLSPQPMRLREDILTMIGRAEAMVQTAHDASAAVALEVARVLLDDAFGDRGSAVARLERLVSAVANRENLLVFAIHGERILPLLQRARRGSDETAFIDRAIAAAGQVAALHPYRPATRELSRRELEVLRLLAAGYDRTDIAGRLFISEPTVRRHAITIYSKLGASSRSDAVRIALGYGLVV
jgi:LuxR family maltose regulon positive regulatory protein